MQPVTLESIVSLCKRRGFVYPSAEIYGGLNGVYDFGHLGALLRDNIRTAWKQSLMGTGLEILFFEGSLLGPQAVWEASGHITNFHDPMIDCKACKHRFRADDIAENSGCPHCGKREWTDIRQFNMMFKTQLGASADNASTAYLRPETAQAIFTNFKNVSSTNRVKMPYGIAQVGKAFRNEITPKQFLFRMREFEQMEIEWFCKPDESDKWFEFWLKERQSFYTKIGISPEHVIAHEHGAGELAHYSKRCIDMTYKFPFGVKELEGIAHRGAFDLTQHTKHSGKELAIHDEKTNSSYIPHIVECSVGVDRLMLALLFEAYHEESTGKTDSDETGDTRTVLKFHPRIAPIKAAFMPLVKKLSEQTRKIYQEVQEYTGLVIEFDEAGSIGKRYRRQDEIGTPLCFTYDFDSESNQTITVRNRDTMAQERISIDQVIPYIQNFMGKSIKK